uniref:MoxR family ATPase n=1 Tax=candidate division WOR-3 bacterium TaxID=2052148 RepID=A0A7V5XZT1_UNCW3
MESEEIIIKLREAKKAIEEELKKVIVGQEAIIEKILITLIANGHALIIGVPGLAKTLIVNTLAQVLNLSFKRIQFTPDLMPSDITGTEIIEEDKTTGKREFRFVKGPIFANIILADEINRTPPKTQAALLQAMQEYKVTVGNETYPLPQPFLVLATQNPIEMEGTYPLPEAQLDRFMFSINITYPSKNEEKEIVKLTTSAYQPNIKPILSAKEILELQTLLRQVPVAEEILDYAVTLVRATRPQENSYKIIKDYVSWGASVRASQYLILGAKGKAILAGRPTPTIDDVREIAPLVLRHRIVLNFAAEADGISADDIIEKLLKEIK